MNYEERRLQSFCSWPAEAGTDPSKIAKAGFFYTERDSTVECFSCGVTISDWTLGERRLAVMTRHRVLSPNCPFVRDPFSSGNVPRGRTQAPAVSSFVSENARLESFHLWPVPYIKAEDLAAAGFYYSGDSDRVQCAFCGGLVYGWVPGDDPLSEHRRNFPQCSFVRQITDTTQSLLPGLLFRNSNLVQGHDDFDSLKRLGVATHRVPRSPKLSTYESRFNTFHHWPPAIAQTPHQLADAGFFFTGQGDEVRCFHCDGGLRLWERADDPWVEHARWFPDCSFVFLVRGQPFIDSCKSDSESDPPSENIQSTVQNGSDSVVATQPDTLSSSVASSIPRPTPRRISEREIQDLMCSPVALVALGAGLELSVVKQALRKKFERTGCGFNCAKALIGAAVSLQVAAAAASDPLPSDDDAWVTPPDSPVLSHRRRPSNAVDALPPRIAPTSPPPITASATAVPLPSNFVPLPTTSSLSSTNASKSIAQLEEEVRRLREWRQCKVCMDREVCVVLLPCGHLVTCAQCTHSLMDCPLCRATIDATVRTFLS